MKLTTRLILIFLVLSLVPLTIVGILSYTSARAELVAAAQDRLITANELKGNELDRWLDGNLYDLQALAQRPLVVSTTQTLSTSSPDSADFRSARAELVALHLQPRQQSEEGIDTLYVLDAKTGRVLAALNRALNGLDFSGSDVYSHGLQGTYIGPPQISASSGQAMIDISTPITTSDGTVVGVLAGTFDPTILNEIMSSVSGISQTQETYLVNGQGEIVTTLRLDDPSHHHAGLHTQATAACEAEQNGVGIYSDYRGVPVIGAYRWLPDIQSCLITEVDLSEALAPVNDLRDEAILVVLAAILVVGGIGYLFARDLVLPLRQLLEGTSEIGRGNLAYRLDSSRTDELGRLAQTFNLMAEDLDAGERALRQANETLEKQVQERTAALADSLEELQQSEVRYRTLFDNVPVGLYRTTIDGRLLDANLALVDMLRFPDRETLLKVDVSSLYADPERRDDQLEQLESDNVLRAFDYQVRCYDGSIIWVEDAMRAIRNESDAIVQFEGSLQDITARRESNNRERDQRQFAEALTSISALLNSTLELDDVLDQILEAVSQVVPHDAAHILLLIDSQASLVRSKGRHAEEMMSYRERIKFPIPETRTFQTMAETKRPLIIDDVHQYNGWLHLEGRDWVCSHLGAPIIINQEVLGFVTCDASQPGIYTEAHAQRLQAFAHQAAIAMNNARLFEQLTDHRDNLVHLVEESTIELRQTKEHIEAILTNSPDPILLVEPDGTILMSNPAFEHLFGAAAANAPDATLQAVFPEDRQPQLLSTLMLISRERQTARLELIADDKDGTPRDLDLALAPIEENGKLLSIVCSLRDITSLRDSERMKDAFMSMAAHELRTPLTSIRGFSEILLSRTLNVELQHRYLNYINEQSEQLGGIIDDLLDVARLKAGRGIKLKREAIDLSEIVSAIIEPISATSPRHTFTLTGLDDLPSIISDRKRLGQVVLNLITNAVKYSPDGGEIAVTGQVDGDDVILRVTDPGIGMTPDQLGHIFEPFYRVDTSNTAQEGTGLGLSVCRMIVEAHGGTVDATSQLGQGSTFTVRLPVKPS